MLEFILVILRYEAFRFVVWMEGNSVYPICRYIINFGMLPDVIAVEIESSDVLVPADQDCRVVVDTDTHHFQCACYILY